MGDHHIQLPLSDNGNDAIGFLFKDLPGRLDVFQGIRQVGSIEKKVFLIPAGLLDFKSIIIQGFHEFYFFIDADTQHQIGNTDPGRKKEKQEKSQDNLGPDIHGRSFRQPFLGLGQGRLIQ